MFSVALLLLLAAGCVKCEQLTQPASVTVQQGQRLTITCQVSYSLGSYYTAWIRQPAGKGLEWIGQKYTGNFYYKDSLKNKFSISLDTSSKTVTLNGENMQPEDTAVYYCASRFGSAYFDYWGQGTAVTVSTETTTSPTLFPLVQCVPPNEGPITVGCLANDFYPESLTFQWTDNSGTTLTPAQYPPVMKSNKKYTGVSLLKVSKSDWDSRKPFNCSVTHLGGPQSLILEKVIVPPPKVTLLAVPSGDDQDLVCIVQELLQKELTVEWTKYDRNTKREIPQTSSTDWTSKMGSTYTAFSVLKVKNGDWDSDAVYTCKVTHQQKIYKRTVSKVPIKLTLNQPIAKVIFNNQQAKLQCILSGLHQISGTISWKINGQDVTANINEETVEDRKISTMILGLSEWQGVKNLGCAATGDLTTITQELTVNRKDGIVPQVTVHILPNEDLNGTEVTMVCLVSSPVLQDFYIAWSEQSGQAASNYSDGINFPPQKTKQGYSVTSVYTTTKKKWTDFYKFSCNVWPAGGNVAIITREVSHNSCQNFIPESKLNLAMNCINDDIEEDEYNSLWSTTSSFIFLFISSLLYSMVFSLVKMKRPR